MTVDTENQAITEQGTIDGTSPGKKPGGLAAGISVALHRIVRFYTRHMPIRKGKGTLVEMFSRLPLAAISLPARAADGRVFRFTNIPPMARQIYFFGVAEPRETEIVGRLVQVGDVVIDVGAHIGWYTTLCSRLVGPEGRVYALEGVPRTYAILEEAIRANHGSHNVVPLHVICGSESGTGTIYEFPHQPLGHSSCRPMEGEEMIPHRVPILSIDDLIMRHDLRDVHFLKIDAEGSEPDVLRGAARALAGRKIHSILLEANEPRLQAFGHNLAEYLKTLSERHGFSLYRVNKNGPGLLRLRHDRDYQSGDMIFALLTGGTKESFSAIPPPCS